MAGKCCILKTKIIIIYLYVLKINNNYWYDEYHENSVSFI